MRNFIKFDCIVVGGLQTNCYIIRSEDTGLIIDPGSDSNRILQGVGDLNVQYIFATHNHFDHIEVVNDIRKVTEAKTYIHPLDWVNGFDCEIQDGDTVPFGNTIIKILHTPGHTPGSCCFLISKFLFSGDTIFPGGPGNTSFPGGSREKIIESIKSKILCLSDDVKIFPGHGPPTTVGNERILY